MDTLIKAAKMAVLGVIGIALIYVATWALVCAVYVGLFILAGWFFIRLAERLKRDLTPRRKRGTVRKSR